MTASRRLRINVLFFGATAEAAGTRSVALELPGGSSAGDAFREVLGNHPALAGHKLLYSVNQSYSDGRELLKDDDELAVFTAVSGG